MVLFLSNSYVTDVEKAGLNLIFCASIKDFEPSRTKLNEISEASTYITKKSEKQITWIPVRERLDPKIIVLIFESSVINP